MAPSSDPADRRATGDRRPEGDRQLPDDEDRPSVGDDDPDAGLDLAFRWVQLREPKRAVEIGANGRVVDSRFHEGYDAWEVLLETDGSEW